MNSRKQDALDYHRSGRKGKIEVVATKPCRTQADLSSGLHAWSGGTLPRDRKVARAEFRVHSAGKSDRGSYQWHSGSGFRKHRSAGGKARHGRKGGTLQAFRGY